MHTHIHTHTHIYIYIHIYVIAIATSQHYLDWHLTQWTQGLVEYFSPSCCWVLTNTAHTLPCGAQSEDNWHSHTGHAEAEWMQVWLLRLLTPCTTAAQHTSLHPNSILKRKRNQKPNPSSWKLLRDLADPHIQSRTSFLRGQGAWCNQVSRLLLVFVVNIRSGTTLMLFSDRLVVYELLITPRPMVCDFPPSQQQNVPQWKPDR